jgi:hypothetical protein
MKCFFRAIALTAAVVIAACLLGIFVAVGGMSSRTVLAYAGVVAFLLGIFPVIHHLAFGLRERKREITDLLDDAAVRAYFDQFYHADAARLNVAPRKYLSDIYDRRFGFRTFLLPGLVYAVMLALAVLALATAVGEKLPGTPTVALVPPVAAYALAGAYLWVVYDLIARYRLRNLVPSAVYYCAFRIAIIVPLAYALAASLANYSQNLAASLAFLLGAFPTSTLFLLARRNAGKILGLTEDPTQPEKPPELEKLQGVNRPIAEAFSDIGVSTLVQLAYDDPIQLAMRTNLAFYFVLDLVSQALVAIYLDLDIARRYSIRGSVEASSLAARFFKNERVANQVVAELAHELKLSEAVLAVILYQIKEDPCSKFIDAIWNRDSNPANEENVQNATSGEFVVLLADER